MPKVFINGQKILYGEKKRTILDVARSAGIYIPTLCDHKELEAYGGCRMCLVEVEGMRNYVPACATTVKDGMVIKTDTEKLKALKQRILQLLLMEHPHACLVCDIQDECFRFRPQMQKSGKITGCYTCPKRDTCELSKVVKYLGIKDLDYEPEYKKIAMERDDPFFDRDYNLCILCARCVRVCEDVRGTGAITLVKRGHETRVNTAFGISLLESGCWFCGACIDVCPTGALSPRKTKWTGIPDLKVETTCVLCGMGCQVELDVKFKKVMDSHPANAISPPNHHLCVLGRFCIPSLVNAPDRLKYPSYIKEDRRAIVSWKEAVNRAAKLLGDTPASKSAFIGSPHMSSESAYLFQKLARAVIGTSNVDFRGSDFPTLVYKELAEDTDFARIQTIERLHNLDWVLSVGSDFVKTHQVVAKAVNMALRKGCQLFTIGSAGLNQRRWSSEYIAIEPNEFLPVLSKLADNDLRIPGIDASVTEKLLTTVSHGTGAILLGTQIMESPEPNKCLRALVRLIGEHGLVFPLYNLGNEAGVIRAGLSPDLLPGPTSITIEEARSMFEKEWGKEITEGLSLKEMRDKAGKGELDLLYVTDGSVPIQGFENVSNIIYQSPYPSRWMDSASVILPSTSFVEEDGTFVNQEFRTLKLKQVVPPPGQAKQDWSIFLDIANSLGADGFAHKSVDKIWKELAHYSRTIEVGGQARRASWSPTAKEENEWSPKYRGAALIERIADLTVFIKALPNREPSVSTETLEDLVKRIGKHKTDHEEEPR